MTGREVVKILQEAGWIQASVRGSHFKMEKRGFRPVPVPIHAHKDLGIGLLKAIERQTNVKLIKRDK